MRIGIDVKTLSKRYTGIAVYVHEMIRHFNEMQVEDEFYLFSPKDFDLDLELGANFHKVIYSSFNGSLSILFGFSKIIKKYDVDLFWGPEHIVPIFRRKCKSVVTIHDLAVMKNHDMGTKFNIFLNKFFVIPSIKKADKVIAISQATANDVVDLAGIPKSKVSVIYNGDSPYKYSKRNFTKEEEDDIRKKYGLTNNYFLFVGTIEPRKNIPTVIKAYNIYRRNGGSGKLVIVGGLGWRFEESLRSIDSSEFNNDIIQTGYCTNEDKEFLYRNACALLFPSLYEGFGFPIVEAMSVGTPVITSNISSMPEVGGKVAFYINNVKDANSLAEMMKKIENMEVDVLEVIRANGIKRANQFSRTQCAKEILRLFHQI